MRTSKRTAILGTIVEVIETGGFSKVTYENATIQCGMSKSRLVHHSPSREDVIRSVHEHMAQLQEGEFIEAAGGPAEEVSPVNCLCVNLQVSLDTATRAELLMSIGFATNPELCEI